jgi:hypothetical protein
MPRAVDYFPSVIPAREELSGRRGESSRLVNAGRSGRWRTNNIYAPPKTRQPVAWMRTNLSDGMCPWVDGNSATRGVRMVIGHAPMMLHRAGERYRPDYKATSLRLEGYTKVLCRSMPTKASTFNDKHEPRQ